MIVLDEEPHGFGLLDNQEMLIEAILRQFRLPLQLVENGIEFNSQIRA